MVLTPSPPGENRQGPPVRWLIPAGRSESDDGIGLTSDEVSDLLATVGHSSKRDIFDMRRSDYLGQFGIGLLSCFMVTDEIRIRSRSARGGIGVEWTGSSDGLFTVAEEDGLPIGTSVHLRPRFDAVDLLSEDMVEQLARLYGEYLPVPISVHRHSGDVTITRQPPFLQQDAASHDQTTPEELATYCRDTFGFEPLDHFPLRAPGSLTSGHAFVMPFSPPPTTHPTARVYLGRILLAERAEDLLPEWAFFIRATVNSDGLTPMASREGLADDAALTFTREQFSNSICAWLTDLSLHSPARLDAFLHIHELAIKQLVLHDDKMAAIFLGWLTLETSEGQMRIDDLVHRYPSITYTRTIDEFHQIIPIVKADAILVNGGYIYDSALSELIGQVYPAATVKPANVLEEFDRLDPPSLADRALTRQVEDRATAVLARQECKATIRLINSDNVIALLVSDPEVLRHIDRNRSSSAGASELWKSILAQTDSIALSRSAQADETYTSRLCLNWNNPLIRSLVRVADPVVFDRCVRLLYVQSKLASRRPLSQEDRNLMTAALTDLITLAAAS